MKKTCISMYFCSRIIIGEKLVTASGPELLWLAVCLSMRSLFFQVPNHSLPPIHSQNAFGNHNPHGRNNQCSVHLVAVVGFRSTHAVSMVTRVYIKVKSPLSIHELRVKIHHPIEFFALNKMIKYMFLCIFRVA